MYSLYQETMLDNFQHGYGLGQQSYSTMHQESWQNGYQGHLSGMPSMPAMPTMPNCFMESPQLSTHQMMFHRNHAMHQDVLHAQNMHQNAWLTESKRQHCTVSPEKYGRFNDGYVTNVGLMASTGGKYPNLIASSEYESFNRIQQAPATMRFEAMRYEQSNWGGNGHYRKATSDGFNLQDNGCQSMEWVFKGL